jgi:hypothetical protein
MLLWKFSIVLLGRAVLKLHMTHVMKMVVLLEAQTNNLNACVTMNVDTDSLVSNSLHENENTVKCDSD